MAKLSRDDVNIYYEVHCTGPVILLSHGRSATSEMWRGQIEPLSREHTSPLGLNLFAFRMRAIQWCFGKHGSDGSNPRAVGYSPKLWINSIVVKPTPAR